MLPKDAENELDRLQWEEDVARDRARAADERESNSRLSRYADYDVMDEYPMIQNVLD